jgi:radical SAM superfamily enzyme YgiQ (UPF0313 family)
MNDTTTHRNQGEMKVLLINPNRYRPAVCPIGLEYAASSLVRADIAFDVVDLNFEPEPAIYRRLREGRYSVVGMTIRNTDSCHLIANDFFMGRHKRIIDRIKDVGRCPVVLGGAGFTNHPREILEYTGADMGVVDCGEMAFPAIVRAIANGSELNGIAGLAWRRNGSIEVNPPSLEGYEELPARRRTIFRNGDYSRVFGLSANIETKRGCSIGCGHCNEATLFGRKIRHRNTQSVIDELKELRSLGISHVHFVDSEINIGSEAANAHLYEAMAKERLNMTWSGSIHPTKARSADYLRLMRESGCREVFLNVDSGDDDILARMKQHHTVEDSIVWSEALRKAGIRVMHGYIVGWPGESTQTIDKSLDVMRRCDPEMSYFFFGLRIHPHTELARVAAEEGRIAKDENLMFPAFYNPAEVRQRLAPYLKAQLKGVNNCLLPAMSLVEERFVNLVQQQFFRDGYDGAVADGMTQLNGLPIGQRLRLYGKAALDCVRPWRWKMLG